MNPHACAYAPQTYVSTNSTTRAHRRIWIKPGLNLNDDVIGGLNRAEGSNTKSFLLPRVNTRHLYKKSAFFLFPLTPEWGVCILIIRAWTLLTRKRRKLGWFPQSTEAKEGRNEGGRMTDLQDVALFCLFYSGVVIYSLWITVARSPARAEIRAQQRRY